MFVGIPFGKHVLPHLAARAGVKAIGAGGTHQPPGIRGALGRGAGMLSRRRRNAEREVVGGRGVGAPLPSSSTSLGPDALLRLGLPFALPFTLPFVQARAPIGGHWQALAVRGGSSLGVVGVLQVELHGRRRRDGLPLALWHQVGLTCCSRCWWKTHGLWRRPVHARLTSRSTSGCGGGGCCSNLFSRGGSAAQRCQGGGKTGHVRKGRGGQRGGSGSSSGSRRIGWGQGAKGREATEGTHAGGGAGRGRQRGGCSAGAGPHAEAAAAAAAAQGLPSPGAAQGAACARALAAVKGTAHNDVVQNWRREESPVLVEY